MAALGAMLASSVQGVVDELAGSTYASLEASARSTALNMRAAVGEGGLAMPKPRSPKLRSPKPPPK